MVIISPSQFVKGFFVFKLVLSVVSSHKARCDKKEGNFNEPVNGINL